MLILLSKNEQGISALDLQKNVSMDATSLRKLLQRGATRMKQTDVKLP